MLLLFKFSLLLSKNVGSFPSFLLSISFWSRIDSSLLRMQPLLMLIPSSWEMNFLLLKASMIYLHSKAVLQNCLYHSGSGSCSLWSKTLEDIRLLQKTWLISRWRQVISILVNSDVLDKALHSLWSCKELLKSMCSKPYLIIQLQQI